MTLVLIGKDLVLEGSRHYIEDKQVPGIYRVIAPHWIVLRFHFNDFVFDVEFLHNPRLVLS